MLQDGKLLVGWDDDNNEQWEQLPDLRPCPRCGETAEWDEPPDDGLIILCGTCSEWLDCGYYDTPQEAADAWNKRPLEDALRTQIATLTAERDAWLTDYNTALTNIDALTAERDGLAYDLARTGESLEGVEEAHTQLQAAYDALRRQLDAAAGIAYSIQTEDYDLGYLSHYRGWPKLWALLHTRRSPAQEPQPHPRIGDENSTERQRDQH